MLEFDLLVVGAGPAGASAALVAARSGLRVAIFERGEAPGTKNVSGALLGTCALSRLLPQRWKEAPFERRIIRHSATFLASSGALSLDLRRSHAPESTAPGYSIVRPRFDRWLAQQAVEAGALLIPETVVDDLLWEGPRVVGVRARRDEGEVLAKIVIAADGVNSILARRARLRPDWRPSEVGLGLKETVRLPAEILEERFGIGPGEGAAMLFVGGLPEGVRGGGFLYTHREGLSVGVVLHPDSAVASGVATVDAFEAFKAHPAVARLLRGSVTLEYSAHLVPEGGVGNPRLFADGLMAAGDAAGLVLNTGVTVEGMDYAIASGMAAGETAVEAIGRGDVSARGLGTYRDRLEANGMLPALRRFRRVPNLLCNPRLHGQYPEAAFCAVERWFAVDGRERRGLVRSAREALRGRIGVRQLLVDGLNAWRSLLWL